MTGRNGRDWRDSTGARAGLCCPLCGCVIRQGITQRWCWLCGWWERSR